MIALNWHKNRLHSVTVSQPGFGKQVVINLVQTIKKYQVLNLPANELEFVQSVSVLKEYLEFHQQIGFRLDAEVEEMLNIVASTYPDTEGEKQIRTTCKEYYNETNSAFDRFCRSRYSVRNYTEEEISLSVLYDCIELAQKSPSFCNRQPTRFV